jgi:acyl-homoserine lactone acylase PvdQ
MECNLGQFFIYQGFNENCGWMHTSNVDVADMYAEKLLLKMTNYSMNTMELLPVIENQLPLNTSKKEN